jgi:hypothetical protein
METAAQRLIRTKKALKTLNKMMEDVLGRLRKKPAWRTYCTIKQSLVDASMKRYGAIDALEQRAIELFQENFNPRPYPGVSIARTPVIKYDDERGVIEWLAKNEMYDLLIPDWDAVKRRALATRDVQCVRVVLAPRVTVDEDAIMRSSPHASPDVAFTGVDVAVPGSDVTVMMVRENGEFLGMYTPCGHPGCLSHLSHPCEGCGRIASQILEKKE